MIISQSDMIFPEWNAPGHVRVVTSTRTAGASKGIFHANNLSDYTGDDPVDVARNWQTMQHSLDYDSLVLVRQVHGNTIVDAATAISRQCEADGITCTEPGIACAVLTADCLPVVLTNHSGNRIAVIHCGWRGLANHILDNAVRQFRQAETLYAWIGPGICRHCYQVGTSLYRTFNRYRHCFTDIGQHQWLCDLSAIATEQLKCHGIRYITHCQLCTYELDKTLYSYRRDGQTGRMATLAWLAHE